MVFYVYKTLTFRFRNVSIYFIEGVGFVQRSLSKVPRLHQIALAARGNRSARKRRLGEEKSRLKVDEMRLDAEKDNEMRSVDEIRRTLDRSLVSDLRAKLETIQAGQCSDVVDEAAWSENMAVAVQAIEVEWQRKRQIQAALDRIRNGRYGVCDACNQPIAEVRLTAVPWATRCVPCEESRARLHAVVTPQGLASIRDGFERRFDDAA